MKKELMDHQALGTAIYWMLLAAITLIAIAPPARQVYRGICRRVQHAFDVDMPAPGEDLSFEEHWRTLVRDER